MAEPRPTTWVPVPPDSEFPLENLPYGIFSTSVDPTPRPGVAIGAQVLDLRGLAELAFFDDLSTVREALTKPVLNGFLETGRPVWQAVRQRLTELLTDDSPALREILERLLARQADAVMHRPLRVENYTDFYASEHHATNVGKLFRPDNPLLPNWKHLPVGYHGRASSVVVSGTSFHRPSGQLPGEGTQPPRFGPTEALDYELELAAVIGRSTRLGERVPVSEADETIFGYLLFNDWSARDIQRWEYQPLGPFLGKNFCSTVSPWIVTAEALESFRVPGPAQDPPVLPYLRASGTSHLDLVLEAYLETAAGSTQLCRTNARHLYWSFGQMLAHHTVGGCNLAAGDLLASGTCSGPELDSRACLLEATEGGRVPVRLADGTERRYLQDGDTVVLRGYAERDGRRIGFGEARGIILPAFSTEH
jgi:fumarylacetoacetase